MKKILSLLLTVALIASLCTSALAADTAVDDSLADVTLKVKETLGIGDDYTGFYGNLNDKGVKQYWSLNWSKEGEALYVSADQTGKIYQYNLEPTNYEYSYRSDFAPKFPSVDRDTAKTKAVAFLKKVLASGETYNLDAEKATLNPSDVDRYYFNSVLKINGLDTPIYLSIAVSTKDLRVIYFSRSDMSSEYVGELPSATPVTTTAQAAALLAGTVKMKLQYVLAESTGTAKGPVAVLRYLPITSGSYVVNAKTGELIDVSKAYSALESARGMGGEGGATMAAADSAMKLTDTEIAGIAKLEGVFTRDQLDEKARAISELGLGSAYTLNSVNYSVNNDTGEVLCFLAYTQKTASASSTSGSSLSKEKEALMIAAGETIYTYKTVTLDGKTGELKSVYTSYPYTEDYSSIEKDTDALRLKATDFLKKYSTAHFDETAPYEGDDLAIPYDSGNWTPAVNFAYCQSVNGYFFPNNRINVSVNAVTGSIDQYNVGWTENVTFESADGILTNEEACKAYSAAFETKLSYLALPVAIDPTNPIYAKYAEFGYSYVYQLILGYTNYSANYISGVDAKTGNVVTSGSYQPVQIAAYDDIGSHYAKAQIEKLAKYGIGFPGKSFRPAKQLTQLDMLMLLMSADGYRFESDTLTQQQIDDLYSSAYYRHILKKEDKNPAKLITRTDLIRTMLTMSGYSKTADLKGIYICHFNDASAIAAADYGYFAIAQGMGILKGDNKGNVNPKAIVTRAEAALMLYNFMSR